MKPIPSTIISPKIPNHFIATQLTLVTTTTTMSPSSKSPSNPLSPSISHHFKRVFTEDDEINLLNSLLNSTTTPILDGRFNEAQITNKIRRLRQRYHKLARSNSSTKTAHDLKMYELSYKIWGPKMMNAPPSTPLWNEEREELKGKSENNSINWSDFPFLMKQVSMSVATNNEIYKEGLMGLGEDILKGLDKKWMELEMEDAAIHARKAELVYNELKSKVEAANKNF